MRLSAVEREWGSLRKAEGAFLKKNASEREGGWREKVKGLVPDKLEDTLDEAFFKAFALIFDKGTGVIEKTYQKEKREQDYNANARAAEARGTRRSLRRFGRAADASRRANAAVSAVGGIGMGLAGLGIPDIPVFIGVLLRSIYQIAISYGFSYEGEGEQIFILRLIEAALLHGDALAEKNRAIDRWIHEVAQAGGNPVFQMGKNSKARAGGSLESQADEEAQADEAMHTGEAMQSDENPKDQLGAEASRLREEQMRQTAGALSSELLYLKFVQGIPIVGVAGGASDIVYQRKIASYASLKYRRRFLEGCWRDGGA